MSAESFRIYAKNGEDFERVEPSLLGFRRPRNNETYEEYYESLGFNHARHREFRFSVFTSEDGKFITVILMRGHNFHFFSESPFQLALLINAFNIKDFFT